MAELKLSTKTPYKTEPLSYYRKWNSFDFYGKSHLRNYADSPAVAIPGTQIKSEKEHVAQHALDRKKFEDSIIQSALLKRHKLKIRDMGAKINAQVYMVCDY